MITTVPPRCIRSPPRRGCAPGKTVRRLQKEQRSLDVTFLRQDAKPWKCDVSRAAGQHLLSVLPPLHGIQTTKYRTAVGHEAASAGANGTERAADRVAILRLSPPEEAAPQDMVGSCPSPLSATGIIGDSDAERPARPCAAA